MTQVRVNIAEGVIFKPATVLTPAFPLNACDSIVRRMFSFHDSRSRLRPKSHVGLDLSLSA